MPSSNTRREFLEQSSTLAATASAAWLYASEANADEKAKSEATNPDAEKTDDGVDLRLPCSLECEQQCRNRCVNDKQIEPRLERVVMVATKDQEERQQNHIRWWCRGPWGQGKGQFCMMGL